jgi:hypothetical protein
VEEQAEWWTPAVQVRHPSHRFVRSEEVILARPVPVRGQCGPALAVVHFLQECLSSGEERKHCTNMLLAR